MKKGEKVKLHLACGPNVVEGWHNLDIEVRKGVKKHDLRKPLPYKTGSVDAIFHEHFIEHLTKVEAEAFLRDCRRALKKGGAMRVGWPDLKRLINAYLLKKKKYMDYVEPYLENHRYGRDWDESFSDLLFDWDHRYAYTAKHLMKVLKDAGFRDVQIKPHGKSDFDIALDFRKDPATTYIEAIK
jgi:predicted SAM-dependent methyltransferase